MHKFTAIHKYPQCVCISGTCSHSETPAAFTCPGQNIITLGIFFLVFYLISCILCCLFRRNYYCFAELVLWLSRVEQMLTALKDPMLLHSRTNEDVKKRLFTLTRKQGKETKRKKPLETSRLALIRSYANLMPTLCANHDLMCLNDIREICLGEKNKKREFFPWQA